MNNADLARRITTELFKADAAGVPGTMGMPALLGGDMCDPSFEGICDQILTTLNASVPEAADAVRYRWLKKMHEAGDEQWFVYGAKSENLDADIDAAIALPQPQEEKR